MSRNVLPSFFILCINSSLAFPFLACQRSSVDSCRPLPTFLPSPSSCSPSIPSSSCTLAKSFSCLPIFKLPTRLFVISPFLPPLFLLPMRLPRLSRSQSGSAPSSPAPSPPIDTSSKSLASPHIRLQRGRSGQCCVPLYRSSSHRIDINSSEIADDSSLPRVAPQAISSPAVPKSSVDSSPLDVPPLVLEEIKHVFSQFDSNNDGKISAEELRAVLKCLGDCITHKEAEQMVKEVDSDGDGFIDLHEFVDLNTKALRKTGEIASVDELTAAFDIFDVDRDGQITAEELHSVLRSLGDDRCTVDDCKKMIRGVDRKGSGHVDFDDFKRMMTTAPFHF